MTKPSENAEFDQFWQAYPRRVGRLLAMKMYARARMFASAEEILAGVERYRQHLPEDVRYIAHPSSWLSAGRWDDDYTPPQVEKPRRGPALYVPFSQRKETA